MRNDSSNLSSPATCNTGEISGRGHPVRDLHHRDKELLQHFTSSAYRDRNAKWRFPQEIVTLAEAKTQARDVKML
jgi:hypothetical protein